MSADSLRKQSKQGNHGQVILPQPINDLSLIESVAGFIHEVVPQAYSSVLPGDSRDGILWARFDTTDFNDPENYPQFSECESDSTPPVLLVLGYATGVQNSIRQLENDYYHTEVWYLGSEPLYLLDPQQRGCRSRVWSVGGSGEATELLSWCQGVVRALRFLVRPDSRDPHSAKRPLVAIVDSSSPGPQFSTLSFISLKTAEVVKIRRFNSPICDVHCNAKSVVVTFSERIAVFDSASLEDRLTITTCYPSPGNSINPIALGTRWLAYGEKRLTTWQRSSGGCEGDGAQSYTSAVIHAAKSLGKGLRELGGSLTGSSPQSSHNPQAQPGIVSIIDIEEDLFQEGYYLEGDRRSTSYSFSLDRVERFLSYILRNHMFCGDNMLVSVLHNLRRKSSMSEEDRGNLIAHFVAHTSAVVALTFDPSGLLLVTADRHGHRFNVFRIHPHPCTSQLTAVHHLYVLHRGETTARVQDIAISWDSRWVAVSSVRGTTHVFPITPYGGLVTVRTHTTPHVVNKLSRFERSAGLRDGRGSPLLLCEAPTTPPPPRLPPFPHPTVITPLAQLRARPDDAPLAAAYAPPRAWLPGRPKSKRTCADSLYIIYASGALMQYDLDPKVIQGVPKEKISFDTPIELGIDAKAEWILPKPPYTSSLCPPLPPGHLLLELPSRSQPPPDKWLSQVEIVTHTGPHRRLWMGPQFTFKSIDPLPPSGGEGDGGPEGGNPLRSNPVNMPHRPYLLVEIGSGSPQMSEADEAGGRLREDLADAMLETQNSSGQAKGKLRRAEVEWQVNPLGAVQTQPAALRSHWLHPIFFEPYSPDDYRAIEQSAAQKNIDAALQRLKQHDQSIDDRDLKVESTDLPPKEMSVKSEASPSCIDKNLESLSVSLETDNSINKSVFENIEEPLEIENSNIPLLPSTSHSQEVKLVAIDDLSSEIPLQNTNIACKETPSSEDPPSRIKDSNEKMSKSSAKKSRKKRNGADKKLKKEQFRQPFEEIIQVTPVSESQVTVEDQIVLPEVPVKVVHVEEVNSEAEERIDLPPIETVPFTFEVEKSLLTCDSVAINQDICFTQQEEKGVDTIQLNKNELNEEIVVKNLLDVEANEECTEEVEVSGLHEATASTLNENVEQPDGFVEETCALEEKIVESSLSLGIQVENITDELLQIEKTNSSEDRDLNGNNTFNKSPTEEYPIIDQTEVTSEIVMGEDQQSCNENKHSNDNALIESATAECSDALTKLDSGNNIESKEVIGTYFCSSPESIQTDILTSIESPPTENKSFIDVDKSPAPILVPVSTEPDLSESFPPLVAVKQETDEFVSAPSKPSRNKNRRRRKEKNIGEVVLSEVTEILESTAIEEESITGSSEIDKNLSPNLEKPELLTDQLNILDEPVDTSVVGLKTEPCEPKECPLEPSLIVFTEEEVNPPQTGTEPSDIPSDQVASTDKSEIEDMSSHSGKESDDSKVNKKERSRRQKRSESSDKDRSELKKKSCSPSSTKPDTKDSESSDEAGKTPEKQLSMPKVPKRKKGKKNEESVPEMPSTENSSLSADVDESLSKASKEKSLNSSSVDSNSESRSKKPIIMRSWSHSASSSEHQNGIEDRDSVYESCNDDGASDSLAFESSKEDFDDGSSKVTATEPSSSNTEERTDSCDKTNQPLKKVRKQKKKKR